MWCLDRLAEYVKTPLKKMLHIPSFVQKDFSESPLVTLMRSLPRLITRQFEYEDELLKQGRQLFYSPFLKVGFALLLYIIIRDYYISKLMFKNSIDNFFHSL